MQRYKQPHMDLHPDGEWILYEDHCEAMKRMAGGGVDAAAFIERKAEAYARDFGYSDMGSLSFGSGDHAQAKMDHYTTLTELAEEIRGLALTEPLQGTQEPSASAPKDCHDKDDPHN